MNRVLLILGQCVSPANMFFIQFWLYKLGSFPAFVNTQKLLILVLTWPCIIVLQDQLCLQYGNQTSWIAFKLFPKYNEKMGWNVAEWKIYFCFLKERLQIPNLVLIILKPFTIKIRFWSVNTILPRLYNTYQKQMGYSTKLWCIWSWIKKSHPKISRRVLFSQSHLYNQSNFTYEKQAPSKLSVKYMPKIFEKQVMRTTFELAVVIGSIALRNVHLAS